MHGLIGSREALQHFPLIWREFGFGCAMRCLSSVFTFRRTTFLEMVDPPGGGARPCVPVEGAPEPNA